MQSMRHRQPLKIVSELNITNLLDTAFILLITFMLVAPQLDHAITVKVPKVEKAEPINVAEQKTHIIYITPVGDGRQEEWIYLDDKQVTLDQLREAITTARAENDELAVLIECDEAALSGILIQVIAAVKNAGVDNIGLGADPRRPGLD